MVIRERQFEESRQLRSEKPPVPARQSSTFCSANRSLDSLTAARISFVVALVWIPGTSNGDFLLFLKIIEKVSPPLLLITTSSVLAILRTSARRCLASEYVYTFIISYSKIVTPISRATLCMPRSSVSRELRRLSAHSKKYASYAYMLNFIAMLSADFMSVFLKSTGICWTISHADATSSFFKAFFFIIAVNAFPISNGKTSGAIKSCPLVSRMILPFSGSFKATAMNVFVSAIIFMGTIVRALF